jgi:hypothetical protein
MTAPGGERVRRLRHGRRGNREGNGRGAGIGDGVDGQLLAGQAVATLRAEIHTYFTIF